jgi:FtsZ-interacting cell division protein ZipA
MSELQISLLAIGVIVVIAVYAYSYWQQRQYRRHFGAAFQPRREDALYHETAKKASHALLDDEATDSLVSPDTARTNMADEACSLLDEMTDYIAEIFPRNPGSADALAPLWQRRFDFGKNVYACGQNAETGAWERVIAESQLTYRAFRLAVQLANRSGAVSESRLSDFRDMARDISERLQAESSFPDVSAAAERAQALDEFCAEVDQMIGINLLPGGGRALAGSDIERVAEMHGMSLQADGAFHLLDGRGLTQFILSNYDNLPFQHHTLNQMRVTGLTLLLDVPRVEQPVQRFDEMLALGRSLAQELRAALVDDHRVTLQDAALAHIRGQIAIIEKRMFSGDIVPGSAQARRLFA